MAEGGRLMFSQEFTNKQLLEWLEQNLQSEINFQSFIDFGIDGTQFPHLKLIELVQVYGMVPRQAMAIYEVICSLVKCYVVKAVIKDAKSHTGIRASLFKKAEEFLASYCPNGESICYNDTDLKVTLLFEEKVKAGEFGVSLSQWPYNNPLTARGLNISIDESQVEIYVEKSKLKYVRLSHYADTETDSPMQSLDEFKGHVSSISSLSVVSTSDPVFKYQSIEKPEMFYTCKPYKMHVKPKAKCSKSLQSDENNVLFGSWTPFHQMFDGMNTVDGIPAVAIKPPPSGSNFESSMLGEPPQKRYKVDLELEFRDETSALELASNLKNGSAKVSETVWKSSVYVLKPEVFCNCLQWRWKDTKNMWQLQDED